jgi:tight adherence protein B
MRELLLQVDPTTLNLILVGAFVVLSGLGVLFVLMTRGRREMAERIQRMSKRPTAGGERKKRRKTAEVQLRKNEGSLKQFEAVVKRLLPNPAKLRLRLLRTGKNITLGTYMLATFVLIGVGIILARDVFGMAFAPALLFGVVFGFMLPHVYIGMKVGRRQKKFLNNFPDAIDVLVRGLKAGLPAAESMRIVAAEMQGPVAEEFTRICDSMKIGGEYETTMWDASQRINLPEFNFFVITLAINRETGGNLGETLENLSDMLRKRRHVKLKVKAMSSEAKASAYIIGSLPFLMFGVLYMLNEDYVMTLIRDPRGWYLIGAAATSLTLGVGIMMKMVKFEI